MRDIVPRPEVQCFGALFKIILASGLVSERGERMQGKTLSIGLRAVLAVFALALFAAETATGQEKVLYSFYNSGGEVLPVAGVISDASGNLYGTAFYGGANDNGMVFELSPTANGWKQTVLYSFNPDGIDGFGATGGLVFDAAGNLYGTTEFGGTGNCTNGFGCGTVFELSPSAGGAWTETIVHDFQGSDGWEVHAGLIMDAAGNLYGTTTNGGNFGQGTAYELSRGAGGSWTVNTLHHFTGGYDGGVPFGGLVLDAAGNLYGTTSAGGGKSAGCRYGCGTVFELHRFKGGNWSQKVLHSFSQNSEDGRYPYGGLVFDGSGNLYGVAGSGGGTPGYGIVFELTPGSGGSWTETVLHNFNGTRPDGIDPSGNLIFDVSGNLYGVTLLGGTLSHGTAFELSPVAGGVWNETTLHDFSDNDGDGYNPVSGLMLDGSGNLYGTTGSGGHYGQGSVYEITP
jgi:uncharacterized repeat protein (TIGR03803 family)